MKRFWLGVALLCLIFAGGLWAQAKMDTLHTPTAEFLDRAAEAALAENWQQATAFAANAQKIWSQNRRLTASLADHTPMDEVETLYAEMEIYGKSREAPHFAACCRQLSEMTRAISQAHVFNWWNLL